MSHVTLSKEVRLGDLDHDPVIMAMPGQEARLGQLEDLLASLPEHGLLQSLKVRVAPDGDRYLVTAGNRRLAALRVLRDRFATIRGEAVTDAWSVAVIHSEETDQAAREQAAAENLQRLPPTVAAEARLFERMVEASSPAEIASRFGIGEKRVRQRLKLAALHDDVLEALDSGKITMAAAEAFTLEADPEKQAKYLKKAGSWELGQHAVRQAFTHDLLPATSVKARLIGEEAYRAAGGAVLEDPFGNGDYWVSADVVAQLLGAHWQEKAAAWTAAGWGFVASAEEYGSHGVWNLGQLNSTVPDGRISGEGFTPEQMAGSGVIYWPSDGRTHFGVVDPKKAAPPEGYEDRQKPRTQEVDLRQPGGSRNTDAIQALAPQVAERFREQPLLALRVLVATLHATMRIGLEPYELPVTIGGDHVDDRDDDDEAEPQFEQGNSYPEALAWALGQDHESLLAYLGELVSRAVVLTPGYGWERELGQKLELLPAIGVPIGFDASAFFEGLDKAYCARAWLDMTGGRPPRVKKGEKLQDLVAARAAETGWLPPALRTSAYAGPHHTDEQPEAATEDDGDEVPAEAAE